MQQLSPAAWLASLSAVERQSHLQSLTDEEQAALSYSWPFWARPNQVAPEGEWRTWLILAGRGFGKTRAGGEWIRSQVCGTSPLSAGKASRVAIVAETAADARDVIAEGESGLLAIHPRAFRPHYEPSKRRLTWPNGAIATLYNGTEPDQLRGPQHEIAWCDEIAKWRYARETWDQLQFGMRLGNDPRVCVTTTPRPISLLRDILADKQSIVTRGSTRDNSANLAEAFLHRIQDKYAGTRLGRQELEAEMLEDVTGAFWSREMIERGRCAEAPPMKRIVVGVDPSGTQGGKGDDVGIVVAGKGIDDRYYVLADRTVNLGPAGWGRAACDAFADFRADRIVAEANFGGAMVEATIKTAEPDVPVRLVTASRGKAVRAEPISALYEQNRVSHVGAFPALEDQMTAMAPNGYVGEGSPDRLDAMVWAVSDLITGSTYCWENI